MHEADCLLDDAQPELVSVVVGTTAAAVEVVIVGTHVVEFAGLGATGNAVRVTYSVFYDVADGVITALRIYMPMDQLIGQIAPAAAANAPA